MRLGVIVEFWEEEYYDLIEVVKGFFGYCMYNRLRGVNVEKGV